MKTTLPSKKQGSTLIIVVSIMVAFTLIVAALLQLASFNEKETIKQLRTTQAHWLAEAGLERALSWIFSSEDFRISSFDNPYVGTEITLTNVSSSYYEIWIEKVKDTDTGFDYYDYTITSTGIVQNVGGISASSSVSLTFKAGEGLPPYAIMNLSTNKCLIKNSSGKIGDSNDENGDILVEGELEVQKDKSVNLPGIIDADEITGDGADAVTEGDLSAPNPPPQLVTTEYDTLLGEAGLETLTNQVLSSFSGLRTLVNGTATIAGNVPDGHKVVATGAITFNGVTLGEEVSVVSGTTIDTGVGGTFKQKTTLFSRDGITIGVNNTFGEPFVSVLSQGYITVKSNFTDFQGIFFADGKVTFESGVQDFRGTIIAKGGFDLLANTTLIYDPSVFSLDSIPINDGENIYKIPGTWVWRQEL